MIPGLARGRVRAVRDDPPQHLRERARPRSSPRSRRGDGPGLFFAGQMSGVEGYVESAASGLLAGIGAAARARGRDAGRLPRGDGARRPRPLHLPERPAALPAHQHRLRSPARARRCASGTRRGAGSRWPTAPSTSLERFRPRAGGGRCLPPRRAGRRPVGRSCRCGRHVAASSATWTGSATPPPTPSGPTARTSSSSPPTSARELGREPRPEDADHLLVRGFLADLHAAGLREGLRRAQARRPAHLLPLPLPRGSPRQEPGAAAPVPAPRAPHPRHLEEGEVGGAPRRARRGRRLAARPAPSWSCSTARASAAPSSWGSTSPRWTWRRGWCGCWARGGRSGWCPSGHGARDALLA